MLIPHGTWKRWRTTIRCSSSEAAEADTLIAANAQDIRAIATRGDLGVKAAMMEKLPNMEIISVFGVGTDAVDFAHSRPRGIKIINTQVVLTDDVADLAVALLLVTALHVLQGERLVRSGAWPKGRLPLASKVSGKTVGTIGMGRIGISVAKHLNAFDCKNQLLCTHRKR